MDRDNASTATQAKSGMTRRGVMRKAAIGTGATLGVGVGGSKIGAIGSAAAIPPLAFGAGAAALGYLVSEGADLFIGDNRDYSGYTGGDALEADVYEGAVQMRSANERVMTSISNNINNSKTVALAKGKAALLTAMNNGDSQSQAQTKMQDAIDSYYSTIQENILTHYSSQISQILGQISGMENNQNTSAGNVIKFWDSRNNLWKNDYNGVPPESQTDVTLLDGTTVSVTGFDGSTDNGAGVIYGPKMAWKPQTRSGSDKAHIKYTDPNSSNEIQMSFSKLVENFDQIQVKRDEVNSTLTGFAGDVYNNYSQGDIPTEDIVDPITAATELNQNYGGDTGQSAFASVLGIPTTAEQSVRMRVHRDSGNVDILADIYTEYTPPDTGSFESGTRYDPTTWDKPIYIAYEYTEDDGSQASEFTQLENPFTIVEVSGPDGEEIQSFKPEKTVNQTADVSSLEEELAQLRQEQERLQNEAEEETSPGGAGGGFFGGGANGIQNLGLVAAGGALIALLLGNR